MAAPSTGLLSTATTTAAAAAAATTASDMVPPLSTPFTAKSACKNSHLTMLGKAQNQVWLNEPFPAAGLTSSDCYPSELLASIAVPTGISAFSPLFCPDWYTTATSWPGNYFACCPSLYTLALRPTGPTSPTRFAYNATCYSNLRSPTLVTAYDSSGVISTKEYNDPTAQAYAHAIDGYAPTSTITQAYATESGGGPLLSSPSLPSNVTGLIPSSTLGKTTEVTSVALHSSSESAVRSLGLQLSTGAIVGIVVGGSAFVLLITLLLWIIYLLRVPRHPHNCHDQNNAGGRIHDIRQSCPIPSASTPSSRTVVRGDTMTDCSSSAGPTMPTTPRSPWGTFGHPRVYDRSMQPLPLSPIEKAARVRQNDSTEPGNNVHFEQDSVARRAELMDGRAGRPEPGEDEIIRSSETIAELP